MFQRVIRKEINGGVRGGGFVENACVEVGWFSGYGEVEEVNGVCGFHSRAKCDVVVDGVDVL